MLFVYPLACARQVPVATQDRLWHTFGMKTTDLDRSGRFASMCLAALVDGAMPALKRWLPCWQSAPSLQRDWGGLYDAPADGQSASVVRAARLS